MITMCSIRFFRLLRLSLIYVKATETWLWMSHFSKNTMVDTKRTFTVGKHALIYLSLWSGLFVSLIIRKGNFKWTSQNGFMIHLAVWLLYQPPVKCFLVNIFIVVGFWPVKGKTLLTLCNGPCRILVGTFLCSCPQCTVAPLRCYRWSSWARSTKMSRATSNAQYAIWFFEVGYAGYWTYLSHFVCLPAIWRRIPVMEGLLHIYNVSFASQAKL